MAPYLKGDTTMKKRNLAMISVFLFSALAGGAIWVNSNSVARTQAEEGNAEQSFPVQAKPTIPLVHLNEKSRAAKKGGETDIRALADEIFTMHQLDEAPAGLGDSMKESLVRAEINYRTGKGQDGVSDASIVRAVNYLALKVGAPAFARTNVFELRRLKAAMLPYTPDLQSRSHVTDGGMVMDRKTINNPKTPTMSPLEATVFMLSLIQQKRFNAEYQLTQEEFVALHGGKRQATSEKLFRGEMQFRQGDLSRGTELEQSVRKRTSTMTALELVNLPHELMYVLGIKDKKEKTHE
jgi:uncharacterized membrane protein